MKFTIWLAVCAMLCWGAGGCQDNRGPTAANKDSSNPKGDMGNFKFSQEPFGKHDGHEVTEFTVTNPSGATLKMIDYGATIVSLEVPDKDGKLGNVTVGLKTPEEYAKNTAFFGATIGRYGNRIARGKFTLDGKEYSLAANNAPEGTGSIQAEVYFSKKYRPLTHAPEACIDRVIADLRKCGLLRADDKILTRHARVIRHANVIFDLDRTDALKCVHGYLDDIGIAYCGRYGDWGYMWTDESFISGERAAEKAIAGCLG